MGRGKAIADCFNYRSKLGLDVALEALREGLRTKRGNDGAIWRFAKLNRVTVVMQPYLETMT
jgi:hypothetical protein